MVAYAFLELGEGPVPVAQRCIEDRKVAWSDTCTGCGDCEELVEHTSGFGGPVRIGTNPTQFSQQRRLPSTKLHRSIDFL